MWSQIKLLSLTVRATVTLLMIGAFLVVLGIFDGYLGWDIFSPAVEELLYGLIASCVAVGAFGAAICVVLGIQEVVRSFRKLVERSGPLEPAAAPEREPNRRTYTLALASVLLLLIVTVATLAFVNRRVEARRVEVFKLIAQDQMALLGPRLAAEMVRIPAPCDTCATPGLREFFRTLSSLSFCRTATLYLADPADEAVLWRYPGTVVSCDGCGDRPGFERFLVARDDERAVLNALHGDTAWIDQKNESGGFAWHQVIREGAVGQESGRGRIRAVLRIDANEGESFRDYEAVAQAVERKRAGKT